MRRAGRIILNLLTALSLLLCVISAGLWIRNRTSDETLTWTGEKSDLCLLTTRGALWYAEPTYSSWSDPRRLGWRFESRDAEPGSMTEWLASIKDLGYPVRIAPGIVCVYDRTGPEARFMVISIRFWVLVLITAPLPLIRFIRRHRRRRHLAPGHCTQCGYDLRASPERCPECGRLAPAAEAP